jgi:hypothetical protein
MANRQTSASRRNLIKRGAIGAVGAAAAAAVTAASGRSSAVAASPTTERTIRLLGRGWHTDTAGRIPGEGDRYGVYGELYDPSGAKAGEFYSMGIGINSPFQVTGSGIGSIELHTLNLADGTIVGIGSGTGLERHYAIVGGTGKYASASGTYVAKQNTYGLGGNGKAELLLTLRN